MLTKCKRLAPIERERSVLRNVESKSAATSNWSPRSTFVNIPGEDGDSAEFLVVWRDPCWVRVNLTHIQIAQRRPQSVIRSQK